MNNQLDSWFYHTAVCDVSGREISMKKWIKYVILAFAAVVLVLLVYVLYRYNIIPHRKYSNADFGITAYVSATDADRDGVDDQTDILQSAKEYVATKPKYKSVYYASGYPDDGHGVCTDVVAQAFLGAGYDLRKLVNEDILAHPKDYDIAEPDDKIDFRRVRNLEVYFAHTAVQLTTDLDRIDEWQGGDVVIFPHHIGIVSDHRNRNGVPFVIHHANPLQLHYEEDILENWGEIVGHYRIDG